MNKIHVEVSEEIDSRPDKVYAILADYRTGHPAILPKQYFTTIAVEQGGQGTGSIVHVHMKVMGKELAYRQIISEPQPGRVLMETDTTAGVSTTFTVDPLDGGQRCRVAIATEAATSPGLTGRLERLFNPSIMRRIFKKELQRLAEYARG